ncbi:unnamed protein product [Owenia fusiformis]|uniref:Thioredoxin domain-containing protein 9 n=1 Tax=Owenia fusiformis TaxID=6347 RepID=A0A8J1Y2A3_OWEFU|nr:unnamed protein product [Owenia fusiformis]
MANSATARQAQELLDDEGFAEEKLLEELEHCEIPAHIREARFEALKKQTSDLKQFQEKGHGTYELIDEQKKFLDITTSEERCVVHFFHEDFRRCSIMDTHLQKLAEKYFETKFARINVDNAKFLVNKLKIRTLPAVICFKEGIVVDKVIGFEELGNTDSFTTETLEKRLGNSGVIHYKNTNPEPGKKSLFGHVRQNNDDDNSDDDW